MYPREPLSVTRTLLPLMGTLWYKGKALSNNDTLGSKIRKAVEKVLKFNKLVFRAPMGLPEDKVLAIDAVSQNSKKI